MNHGEWLGESTLLCHVYNQNPPGRDKEEWQVGVWRLLSPCLFQLEYLSPCLPTPWEWSFVMSKLPGATIGCGERPADQTKLRGREPSVSLERYIYRGQDSWSRHQRSCNMAKVVEKSWESQTTNTKRWRKRKNQSRSRSRGASKVRWFCPSFSSPPFILFPPPPIISLSSLALHFPPSLHSLLPTQCPLGSPCCLTRC